VAIPEEKIRKTMDLLTTWNPLGDKAKTIGDLDNYRTEAIDILFNLQLADPSANPARIVQNVLNQAFDLSLSLEECADIGREIQEFVR
jgi:hypothetical protein